MTTDQTGVVVFSSAFLLGILGVFTCACNYAAVGVIVGYSGTLEVSGGRKNIVVSSLFFLLGTIISILFVGCLVGFAGKLIGTSLGNY